MKRLALLIAAFVLATLSVMVGVTPARADDNESVGSVSRYHQDVQLAVDGTATVTVDMEYDFGSERGHGPFVVLVTKMAIKDDPDHWRQLPISVKSVTSPSGAPANLQTSTKNQAIVLKIGAKNRTVTGKQTYRIVYTIRGLVQPNNPQPGGNTKLDEFNWSAVGGGWEVPLSDVKVTVSGPADAVRTACFQGRSFNQPCTASGDGSSTMTFSTNRLGKGEGMQVVSGFPAGTFKGAEPTLTRRYTVSNMFPVTPVTAGGGLVVAALSSALVLRKLRTKGSDEAYQGLAPGMVPAAGETGSVGKAAKAPIAVAFQPPKGATPGEVGTLMDASADNRDVTATMIDLSVRGHMVITPGEGRNEFTFTRTQGRDALLPYEDKLLSRMFVGDTQITERDLAKADRSTVLTGTRTDLYHRVTSQLHWFRTSPQLVRMTVIGLGLLLMVAGAGIGLLLGFAGGWGIIGLGLIIPGLLLIALHKRVSVRSAQGSAVLAQAKGFELYLTTAEADQIKFEEGIDVFSRYLPYAIVFGVADRWVKIFQDLAAKGIYQGDTSWYGGNSMAYFYGMNLASSFDHLTQTMSSSMNSAVSSANAASAGSSGSSGFSGGGGFGGGGGGSW